MIHRFFFNSNSRGSKAGLISIYALGFGVFQIMGGLLIGTHDALGTLSVVSGATLMLLGIVGCLVVFVIMLGQAQIERTQVRASDSRLKTSKL